MRRANFIPRSIAIGTHPAMPESAAAAASQIEAALLAQGAERVLTGSLYDESLRSQIHEGRFDLLIALGGDGTMLRAGRLCAPINLPVLGINMGSFGFLIEVQHDQWQERVAQLLQGKFYLEDRMMLCVQHWQDETMLSKSEALNEVVVTRGQQVRPIHLRASSNSYQLADFIADGLIVSTATGSTAYALAAGGPILAPEQRNILIVPLAPHLSMDRSIVLEGDAVVTVQAFTRHEAVYCVDGQPSVAMQDGDMVRVTASQHQATFVRFQEPGYFYKNVTKYMNQNPIIGKQE